MEVYHYIPEGIQIVITYIHILHASNAVTTQNQTGPPPQSVQRNPLPYHQVSRRKSQCTRRYTRISLLIAWESFCNFYCCALIGVRIKRHVSNGFQDSGGPPDLADFKCFNVYAWGWYNNTQGCVMREPKARALHNESIIVSSSSCTILKHANPAKCVMNVLLPVT